MQSEQFNDRDVIESCFSAIGYLSLPEQAECLLIAAERCLPVWKEWAQNYDVPDLSDALIDCFKKWLNHDASSLELEAISRQFHKSVPQNLPVENDATGGFAGWALFDVAMIALDLCEDVHEDIYSESVAYAAAASCGVQFKDFCDRQQTNCQLQFMASWWNQCCDRFPKLNEV